MTVRKVVELVLCHEDAGCFHYTLSRYVLQGLIVDFDLLDLSVVLEKFSGGNVYLVGYLYEGKFFDQLCYLGKGKLQ